jgi:predicted nucleotidyltransferase
MQVTDHVTRALEKVAAAHPAVRALWVFGSRAKNEARPDSDLDLGVLFAPPQPLDTALRLEHALAQAAGMTVQLVDAARTGAFVALDIVRGERIYCRDARQTDEFELYVMRRAGDLLPFERERVRMLTTPTS